jgi:hypothetical protein
MILKSFRLTAYAEIRRSVFLNARFQFVELVQCRNAAIVVAVSLFMLAEVSSADPFTFENTFSFRDRRDNRMIGGGFDDFIQFGPSRAVIPGTNTFVPGITVTGTNSVTNETFALEACGNFSQCYFALVPYSFLRAIGSWTINGMSGPDSDQIVTDESGRRVIPYAENIQILNSGNPLTPIISWDLPSSLGLDDRWRIRVINRNATASFNARYLDAGGLPSTTTHFRVPAGVITTNGRYLILVMLEESIPFGRSRVAVHHVVGPAALSDPFVYRERRDSIALGGSIEDILVITTELVDTEDAFIRGATIIATNPGMNGTAELEECSGPAARFPYKCYFAEVPFSESAANNTWQIHATNPTLDGILPEYATGPGTEPLPFAQDVKVSGSQFTPTFSWTRPTELVNHLNGSQLLNDGNVYAWRIRVNPLNTDGTIGDRVFDSLIADPLDTERRLPLDTTSFQVPAGFITEPGRYVASIMLEGWRPFNRSRVMVPFGRELGDRNTSGVISIITNILLDDD